MKAELFNTLKESLSRTDEWEVALYTITHKPSGIILWVDNGPFFLHTTWESEVGVPLSLWHRLKIWKHVQHLRTSAAIGALSPK